MEGAKDRVVREFAEVRQKIIETATSVPRERQDEIFLGIWSLKDLLAHLAGWDFTNVEAVKEILRSKTPNCFKHWNPDWAAYNAKLVQQYKYENWVEMLTEVQLSHHDLVEFLQQIPADNFQKDFGVRLPGGRVITIAHYLQAEIDDEREHYQQIKRWLG